MTFLLIPITNFLSCHLAQRGQLSLVFRYGEGDHPLHLKETDSAVGKEVCFMGIVDHPSLSPDEMRPQHMGPQHRKDEELPVHNDGVLSPMRARYAWSRAYHRCNMLQHDLTS